MTVEFELNVEPRTDLGKGASRRLRLLGNMVPAVIYGGEQEPIAITISHKDIHHACQNDKYNHQYFHKLS